MSRLRGFTLLEVMIALAILGVALTAIIGINGSAIAAHEYAKRVTVATMLARSKMADLESKFNEEGFTSEFDQEVSGDFSDEGWDEYRWKAEIVKPELDAANASGMVQQLVQSFLGSGQDQAEQSTNGGPVPAMAGAAAGQMQPMIEAQMQQLTTTMEQAVREVRLSVSWKEGNHDESVDVTTHFVVLAAAGQPGGAKTDPGTQDPADAAKNGQLPGQMPPGQMPGQFQGSSMFPGAAPGSPIQLGGGR